MNLSRIALLLMMGLVPATAESTTEQNSLPAHIGQAFEDYIAYPGELVPILASVQNQETADAAVVPLRRQLEKLYDLKSGIQGIQSLTPSQQVLVKTLYERRMREQWGEVFKQIFRLQTEKCYQSREFSRMFRVLCMMLQK